MPSTRWIDHLSPLDAEVSGRQQPIRVGPNFDGEIGIDLSADVVAGGELTDPSAALRRLPTDLETDYEDVDDLLGGSPTVTDNIVAQRVSGMARDRVYRLEVSFGPAGNRRDGAVLIATPE